jgi:Collagen triple helix repeat (20 copies)
MKTLALVNAKKFLGCSSLLGAGLLLSACGGGDSTGPSGQSIALRTVAEAAGANCATGGTKIEAGPDSNANGSLEAGEVKSTAYVCNGQAGLVGATGVAGVQGLAGAPGAPGIAGTPGATGPAGATGTTGLAGPQGIAGTPGATGPAGATGTTGLTGPQGIAGTPGATGPAGPTGATGLTGPQGVAGTPGAAGPGTSMQSCTVPANTQAAVDACGDITTQLSTLIQFGIDTTGKGIPDDPAGITSSVMICGIGAIRGSTFNPKYLKTGERITCATII